MRGTISVVLFCTRTWYRVFILWYEYSTRPFSLCIIQRKWEDGHKKIKGKRGIEKTKGMGGMGIHLAHMQGQVCWFSWTHHASHPSYWDFSPGCQYEVSPSGPFACCYSVYAGPNSGMLSFGLPLFPPISPTQYKTTRPLYMATLGWASNPVDINVCISVIYFLFYHPSSILITPHHYAYWFV
jgi:hypothetical protein